MAKRYMHGFNDIGGEHFHGDRPGWTLVNEQVGLNISHGGGNYDAISNRGIGVVVRMNHAYGDGGTIPLPAFYREYAQACASFARNSSPVDYFIVANEPNLERPNGVVITPAEYARCFTVTYEAIKKVKQNAKIVPAALAPYNASPIPWVDFMAEMLEIIAKSTGCDAVNFHAYARSMNPQDIYSNATMDEPLEGLYYGFKTCEDALLKGTPTALRHLPAMNTEFDVYDAWENRNTGVITEHYKYFNDRNAVQGNQQVIMSLCFRWLTEPDVINEKDWGMRNKPELLKDFEYAVSVGYQSLAVGGNAPAPQPEKPNNVFLPDISTGSAKPTMPERNIDPRATARGVRIETPPITPGQDYWFVEAIRYYNEQEADRLGPDHHMMIDVLDEAGNRIPGVPLLVEWGSGDDEIWTEAKAGEPYSANKPLSPGDFSVRVNDGFPSEKVINVRMGDDTEQGFNPGIHTTHGIVFRQRKMAAQPQQPSPQPQPTPAAKASMLAHPVQDPRYRGVTQAFGVNGDYYKRFKVDGVPLRGHNGIDFGTPIGAIIGAVDTGRVVEVANDPEGYGLYVKLSHAWGESLYAHLNKQLVSVGETVSRGEPIALSGNSGNSTGPHLHFGLRVAPFNRQDGWGGYTDPAPYLINTGNVGTPTQPALAQPKPVDANTLRLIKEAAQEFQLDWRFLASLAWYESSWMPTVTSPVGAMGIMQIMPPTWEEWSKKVGATNPYNDRDNIRTGAAYLAWILKQVRGDEWDAVAAFNFGIGNILNGIGPPPETEEHANRVIKTLELLEAIGA